MLPVERYDRSGSDSAREGVINEGYESKILLTTCRLVSEAAKEVTDHLGSQ